MGGLKNFGTQIVWGNQLFSGNNILLGPKNFGVIFFGGQKILSGPNFSGGPNLFLDHNILGRKNVGTKNNLCT